MTNSEMPSCISTTGSRFINTPSWTFRHC
jgi:hypothetical protein